MWDDVENALNRHRLPAEKAAQARSPHSHRIAEHLRDTEQPPTRRAAGSDPVAAVGRSSQGWRRSQIGDTPYLGTGLRMS